MAETKRLSDLFTIDEKKKQFFSQPVQKLDKDLIQLVL